MSFSKFNFSNDINLALTKHKYIEPTSIQSEVIPLILDHHDIMAEAKTGSGKSAAFILPILQMLSSHPQQTKKHKIKVLVLVPTRELCIQISQTFIDFASNISNKVKVISIIGGESIGNQLLDIQQGCDIVVSTTGRLLDIINKKQINLSHVDFFVLDEADKMLDFSFEEELSLILKDMPTNRQNLLFSATYPDKMQNIISKITTTAKKVIIEEKKETLPKINQRVIKVNDYNRGPLLRHLLKLDNYKKTLVFMVNKRACDNIANKFKKYGFKSESFHGDLIQEERNETLKMYKNGDIKVLFATDLASRGLHIEDIDCVVNYDLPRSSETYIHRIGRTARAGKSGTSISFIDYESMEHFKLIEKKCKISIDKEEVIGFELEGIAKEKEKGSLPIKGKRKSKKDKLREQGLL